MKIIDVLVRHNVPLDGMDAAIAFYRDLLQEPVCLDLPLLEGKLHIVQIGKMLLFGHAPELAPSLAMAKAVYLVEGIEQFSAKLRETGAAIVEPLADIATGKGMVALHPDGLLVEYVEHKESRK